MSAKALVLLLLLAAAPRASAAPKKDPFEGLNVRSKEYVVRRSPTQAEEFIGDVHYKQPSRQLKADWALLERGQGRFQARGSVWAQSILQSGDVVEARGHETRHDRAMGSGSLMPLPGKMLEFQHKGFPTPNAPKGSESLGVAKVMTWNERKSEVILSGDVHAWGTEGRFWAEKALYQHDLKTMTLSGRRPVVSRKELTWTGALQADEIKGFQNRERLEANGRVQGWIYFKEQDKAGKKR